MSFISTVGLMIAGGGGAAALVLYRPAARSRKSLIDRRHRPLALPFFPVPLGIATGWRILLGDGTTPLERALIAEEEESSGLSRLKWQALFAGYGDRTLLWLRLHQGKGALTLAATGAALILAVPLPAGTWLLVAPASITGSFALLHLELSWRVTTRRRSLCMQLVPLLYNLANLTGTGLSVKDALRDLADPDGNELARELGVVLRLLATGVRFERALRVFSCRCHTPEVTAAVNRIISAQGSKSARRTLADALADIADATFVQVTASMRRRKAQAVIGTISVVVVTALPTWIIAALGPALFAVWQTLR